MADDLVRLHRLLDLPPGASPTILRFAYDQQMAAAVRTNNHRRALELSAALDALPPGLRDAVYPTMSTRKPGSVPPAVAAPSTRRSARRRSGAPLKGVLLLLLLTAGVGYWAYWRATHPTLPSSAATVPWTASASPNPHGVIAPAPSGYQRAARSDARFVVMAVQQCQRAHRVPVTSFRQVGHHLTFRCRGSVSRVFLQPGDEVAVAHRGRRLVAEVVAPDGEVARAGLRLSPPR